MPVTADLRFAVTGDHTSVLDLGTAKFPFSHSSVIALTNGTGAGNVDRVFTDQRTLTASATENLDLAGALTDAFGATITFVTIKAVIVKASASNNSANEVQVTRPATNGVPIFMAAGDGISLKPGYSFVWFGSGAGVTVTAGTGDLLTFTNSAGTNSVVYDVIILGTSA